jgi:two-component sensor histidine kinase/HAMP domain-containing protein
MGKRHIIAKITGLSLRWKFFGIISPVMFGFALSFYWYYPGLLDRMASEDMQDKCDVVAAMISTNLGPALFFRDSDQVHSELQIARLANTLAYAVVENSSGKIYAAYNMASADTAGYRHVGDRSTVSADNSILKLKRPIAYNNRLLGMLYLGFTRSELLEQLRTARSHAEAAAALVLVVGFLAAFAITTMVTAHLRRMAKVVKRVQAGDMTPRLPIVFQDEVGRLAAAFNSILDRLEHAYSELEISNIELESHVAVRTKDLEREISEHRRTEVLLRLHEQKLEASLKEKVVLLKEIHHRVKNNLQVISSLLNLQAYEIADTRMKELFLDSQNRVRSMAIIHERLYRSENFTNIDFGEYLQGLGSHLIRSYQKDGISFHVKSEEILLGIDIAIPCGLIANELISNSLKHAFPDRKPGTIAISVRKIDLNEIELSVHDDGIGFPKGADFRKTASMGMNLVMTLTQQIMGTIALDVTAGTTFTITFPLA